MSSQWKYDEIFENQLYELKLFEAIIVIVSIAVKNNESVTVNVKSQNWYLFGVKRTSSHNRILVPLLPGLEIAYWHWLWREISIQQQTKNVKLKEYLHIPSKSEKLCLNFPCIESASPSRAGQPKDPEGLIRKKSVLSRENEPHFLLELLIIHYLLVAVPYHYTDLPHYIKIFHPPAYLQSRMNVTCSKLHSLLRKLKNTTVGRQSFAGHVVGSRPMKGSKKCIDVTYFQDADYKKALGTWFRDSELHIKFSDYAHFESDFFVCTRLCKLC